MLDSRDAIFPRMFLTGVVRCSRISCLRVTHYSVRRKRDGWPFPVEFHARVLLETTRAALKPLWCARTRRMCCVGDADKNEAGQHN